MKTFIEDMKVLKKQLWIMIKEIIIINVALYGIYLVFTKTQNQEDYFLYFDFLWISGIFWSLCLIIGFFFTYFARWRKDFQKYRNEFYAEEKFESLHNRFTRGSLR